MTDPAPASTPDIIVCHSTKWYLWRRVIPMSILPLFFSAYFFYDWKVGYPEKKMRHEAFQEYKKAGKTEEWVKYAADQGWDKEPEEKTQAQVDEQFTWGVAVGVLGIISSVYYLLSYPKKLVADRTSFTPPWGPKIEFSSVKKIDKRPWRHKGLAKVYHTIEGAEKKAVIDDLRFLGADKILERLESNFDGEIVDLADEPVEETSVPAVEEPKENSVG